MTFCGQLGGLDMRARLPPTGREIGQDSTVGVELRIHSVSEIMNLEIRKANKSFENIYILQFNNLPIGNFFHRSNYLSQGYDYSYKHFTNNSA